MPDSILTLHSVGKRYGHWPLVLSSISWHIPANTRFVILGSSGSGKTTLLSILGLLLRPSEGQVLVQGEDVWQWPERRRSAWRTANLGYVWQDAGLLPELTLLENVNLPLSIRRIPKGEWNGKELLDRVGLGNRTGAFPHHISGGEAQRAAIARALAGSPRLVIADEPTGSLQRSQAQAICRLLLELQEELGFGLVVATHNEALVEYLKASPLWIVDGCLRPSPPKEGM